MSNKREGLIKSGVISEIEKTLFILDKKIKDNYELIVKDLIKDIKKADIFAVIQGELLEKPYCICEYRNEKSV